MPTSSGGSRRSTGYGYCHEADYARGLGYLAPYRPVSAWHQQRPYSGDLLAFEAQMKTRLQFAVFPQMIAHQFPISQQAPNARAAALLEVYAPLFNALRGKTQILLPHCVAASGPNDVNLFLNGAGQTVAVVTSRVRFLTRNGVPQSAAVTIRTPWESKLRWARVLSADGEPYSVSISHRRGEARVLLPRHASASVIVAGPGVPPMDRALVASAASARLSLDARVRPPKRKDNVGRLPNGIRLLPVVRVTGLHAGTAKGRAVAYLGSQRLGDLVDGPNRFVVDRAPAGSDAASLFLRIRSGDEGTWYAVERAELLMEAGGCAWRVADWRCETGRADSAGPYETDLQLVRIAPEALVRSTARFVASDSAIGGNWVGRFGAVASLLAGDSPAARNGFGLTVKRGEPCIWAESTPDTRALTIANGSAHRAACWFEDSQVILSITPTDNRPYRLTLYVLDYDRNGRSEEIAIADESGIIDIRAVPREETARGVYLSWRVTGPVAAQIRKMAGYNVVLSGVFVDPDTDRP